MIISGICTFVTLMVYMQSDYERNYCDKITASVIETGNVNKEVIDRGKSHVEKYYQDITIQFTKGGTVTEKYCENFFTNTQRGYSVGDEIVCYVDNKNNIKFSDTVQENLFGTLISFAVFAVSSFLLYRVKSKTK